MFSLIFEIIGGFLLAILREIPQVIFRILFLGFFDGSISKNSKKHIKQPPIWLKVIFASGLIAAVLFLAALVYRYFNG